MNKTKYRYIIIIVISAILVSTLFNIRVFLRMYEMLSLGEHARHRGGIQHRMYFAVFNFIIEFIVFSFVAFFNLFWLEKIIKLSKLIKGKILVIILSNLTIFFILTFAGKIFHNAFFSTITEKEIRFDITHYSIINITVFLIAITVANLLILMRKMKESEIEKIRLIEEKTNAELAVLKEQISPHFFFNTLSSLSTIVRNEKKEVGLEFIQDMSNTYRYTLSSGRQDLVSLKEELDFIQSYVFILKKRFGKKLIVNFEVPENAYKSKIPPMSLQLLVENAIQHNVITQSLPLTVKLFIENNMICVENNLQEKESIDSMGLGLENLSNRFRLLAQKDIVIDKDKHKFSVKLPLL